MGKKFSGWWLLLLPGGTILYLIYRNWGPGAVKTDEQGNPTDFTSDATRELRARNPLGVSSSIYTRAAGQVSEDNELNDHLAVMPNTQAGLNAGADDLLNSGRYFGNLTTPQDVGAMWSKGDIFDKDGISYGNSLAEIMKLPADSTLNFGTDAVNLMKAIARMENGTPFVISIPDELYTNAVIYAQQRKGGAA